MAPGVGVVRQAVRHACEWPVVAVTRSQTQGARAGMVATAILLIALLGWHGNTATTVAAVHYDRAFPELLLRPLSEASRQFGHVQTTRSVGGYDYDDAFNLHRESVRRHAYGFAPQTTRGLSKFGGVIEETGTNPAGGRIFTANGPSARATSMAS